MSVVEVGQSEAEVAKDFVVVFKQILQDSPYYRYIPAANCSELFAELYGAEAGVGARSALPSNTLPGGMAVEIEMILEVKPL